MKDIEKRLHNLEVALLAYHSLTKDLLPQSTLYAAEEMMSNFFDSIPYKSNSTTEFIKWRE